MKTEFEKTLTQSETIQSRVLTNLFSAGIWGSRSFDAFLGSKISPAISLFSPSNALWVGWGRKPSGLRAVQAARRNSGSAMLLEDGFLRSVGLGVKGAAPLSLVFDDTGIYYDSTFPSSLERLISSCEPDLALRKRVECAIDLIRQYRLSKYNHAPEKVLPPTSRAS